MFDKIYFGKDIVSGQDAKTHLWYCKQLNTRTAAETKTEIEALMEVYAEVNKEIIQGAEEETKKPAPKAKP